MSTPPLPSISLSSTSTFLSSAYLSSIGRDTTNDLQSFLDGQAAMEAEAREAMPFATGECSWEKGYVRQMVWSCRDCNKGICYGCSISCHAEHDLVELFQRRKFRCDCPTAGSWSGSGLALSSPGVRAEGTSKMESGSSIKPPTRCALQPQPQPQSQSHPSVLQSPNAENVYTRNFTGAFCRCPKGERYDPMEEDESMLACLACEDWFHEGCLNLYDPDKAPPVDLEDEVELSGGSAGGTGSSAGPVLPSPSTATSLSMVSAGVGESSIPQTPITMTTPTTTTATPAIPSNPALLRPETYAHLICGACIAKHPITRRLAGTEGWMVILPRETSASGSKMGASPEVGEEVWADRWEVVGAPMIDQAGMKIEETDKQGSGKEVEVGMKRKADTPSEDLSEEQENKRTKLDSSASVLGKTGCILPPPNERAQRAYDVSADTEGVRGKGDVFLAEGQREKLVAYLACPCQDCAAVKSVSIPFPLTEEEEGELYEPPREEEDDEPVESIDQMTAKALDGLPRSQAIETMIKFNEMKDKLKVFLEGFRGGDRVVKEEDIRLFVDGMREQAQARER